jgi:hypothetical protein
MNLGKNITGRNNNDQESHNEFERHQNSDKFQNDQTQNNKKNKQTYHSLQRDRESICHLISHNRDTMLALK